LSIISAFLFSAKGVAIGTGSIFFGHGGEIEANCKGVVKANEEFDESVCIASISL